MISTVDICNLALGHLGQKKIAALTEPSVAAQTCALIFAPSRDTVLRAANWNFASKTEPLTLISGESVPGWDYLYKLPIKCLFIRKLLNEATVGMAQEPQYEQMLTPSTNQKAIATDLDAAYIKYTYQVTDPNLFDVSFVDALSYLLAAKLAPVVTGDDAKSKSMSDMYRITVDQAKLANASENHTEVKQVSGYLEAR